MLRILVVAGTLAAALPAWAQDKAVYHIDDSAGQAMKALRSIRNQLDVAPDTQIVVVALGEGVDFLFEGARDPKSEAEYAPLVSALKSAGVEFDVCEITMQRRKLTRDRFVLEADYTRAGVVRLTQLQLHDHYAYIKP